MAAGRSNSPRELLPAYPVFSGFGEPPMSFETIPVISGAICLPWGASESAQEAMERFHRADAH
jgi:hypothetical protein